MVSSRSVVPGWGASGGMLYAGTGMSACLTSVFPVLPHPLERYNDKLLVLFGAANKKVFALESTTCGGASVASSPLKSDDDAPRPLYIPALEKQKNSAPANPPEFGKMLAVTRRAS